MSKTLRSTRKAAKRGRPPQGGHTDNSVAFSIRARPELLLEIDQAAELAEKSRSQHIQDLLIFAMSKTNDRRPDIWSMVEAFARMIEYAEHSLGFKWHDDAFTAAAIGRATQGMVTYYGGKGEITVPAKAKDLGIEGWPAPATPEEVGDIIKMMIVAQIEISGLRDGAVLKRLKERGHAIPADWADYARILHDLRSKPQPA